MSALTAARVARPDLDPSDEAPRGLCVNFPRKKPMQRIDCDWCGRSFLVEIGGRGRPRRYCERTFTDRKGKTRTCGELAAAWRMIEDWTGETLGDLAQGEGDNPREAAKTFREKLMEIRKEIRDPKTGRLL